MAEKNIKFISEKHKAFYMEKMQNAKFKDVYHQALYYCLGVNADTRLWHLTCSVMELLQ